MKQSLLVLTLITSMFAQAKPYAPVTMDINDQDSYMNFSNCKKTLGNTVVAMIGFDDLSSPEALRLKNEIKFSPLVQISTRRGPTTGSEGAQIYKFQGHLLLKDFYSARFVIESGQGNCEIQKITIIEPQ
ncbi:MAG: hypothetical protein ACXWRE_06830 [Pseudobdellovibrionaceae bacterium]